MNKRYFAAGVFTLLNFTILFACVPPAYGQTEDRTAIDVIHYKINAEIIPDSHTLKAKTQVTFRPGRQTQSAVFEMNGSLLVTSVKGPDGTTSLQFIQDKINELNIKIDLAKLYPAGSDITLSFEYEGQLATPEGGPLPEKRLAYIGPEVTYLFYAARWFPFHNYAADKATSDISLTAPDGWTVAGRSDLPVTPVTGKDGKRTFRFEVKTPDLPGSFAAGKFITRSVKTGEYTIDFYVQPGSESQIDTFGQEVAQIFQFYNSRFGSYQFGPRYTIAEIDNETLDSYSGAGIAFFSHYLLNPTKGISISDVGREVAYQWWGQAVGLKRFDDVWISQGLSQYSSVLYRESTQSSAEFNTTLSELLELGLAYEQEAPIARAPGQLNDQSPAYRSIVYYKGAYVFHMLRGIIGDDKFFNLLKTYYSTYKGQNAGISDFENLAEKSAGSTIRGFFGLWVDSTGAPEFKADYSEYRTKAGKFKVRGVLRQNLDTFRGPVTVAVEAEGGREAKTTVDLRGTSGEFELTTDGKPLEVVIDPENRYMRVSDSLRVSVVVRRGIQNYQREEYAEAEDQFRAALKLNPRSSWAWYNLGLLYKEQRNWSKAIDSFTQSLGGDLDPSWLEVWCYIYKGNAYDASGNRDRAIAEYNKAKDNGSNYNGAQKAVEKYLGEPYKKERGGGQTT